VVPSSFMEQDRALSLRSRDAAEVEASVLRTRRPVHFLRPDVAGRPGISGRVRVANLLIRVRSILLHANNFFVCARARVCVCVRDTVIACVCACVCVVLKFLRLSCTSIREKDFFRDNVRFVFAPAGRVGREVRPRAALYSQQLNTILLQ
jgi:hypothetical protein